MKLSFCILFEELAFLNPVLHKKNGYNDMLYSGVQILKEDVIPLDQHLQIIGPDDTGNISLSNENDRSYIIFNSNISPEKLLSHVQAVFLKYRIWEENINRIIFSSSNIQEICDASNDVFQNPLIVYDNNLLVIALSNEMPGLPEWEYDQLSKKLTLPLEILNDFKLDTEFKETMSTKGTHMYAKHILGCRGLYNNIWIDNIYSGRVCIHELGRDIMEKDYCLLEYISEIITKILMKNEYPKNNRIKQLEQSFMEIIEGNKINELFFIEQLNDINWKNDDYHVCVQIMIEERDSTTSTSKYTCNRLENQFPGSLVFNYNNSILMILNLNKSDKGISDLMTELKIFLREGLFRAGISMTSNDFFRIRESYIQTTLAVKVGEKIDPMYWYFHFDDYTVQAMFYEMSKNISAEMYCNRSLFELKKYDTKNDTELFETLNIYLNSNMNIAHTSEKLFIHRSTLIYRLERINSLITEDLKNPDDRFKLLLSYHLLKWRNFL